MADLVCKLVRWNAPVKGRQWELTWDQLWSVHEVSMMVTPLHRKHQQWNGVHHIDLWIISCCISIGCLVTWVMSSRHVWDNPLWISLFYYHWSHARSVATVIPTIYAKWPHWLTWLTATLLAIHHQSQQFNIQYKEKDIYGITGGRNPNFPTSDMLTSPQTSSASMLTAASIIWF